MTKDCCDYTLANKRNGTLYAGVVNRASTTMVDAVWTHSADQIVEAYKRARHHDQT